MLTYDLDRRSGIPKYEYLYRRIRRDVRTGVLAADTRMPSKRAFAAHLDVSVGTVEHAYDMLTSEGYLVARPGSGFFVARSQDRDAAAAHGPEVGRHPSSAPHGASPRVPHAAASPSSARQAAHGAAHASGRTSATGDVHAHGAPYGLGGACTPDGAAGRGEPPAPPSSSAQKPEGRDALDHDYDQDDLVDLRANRCSLELFPAQTWSKIMRRVLSDRPRALLDTVPFNGLLELRRAIANHLYDFRGMRPAPENIVVGAGTEYLYGRLMQLFGPAAVVAAGDPGYKKLAQVTRSAGALWKYVPVDRHGMVVDRVELGRADVVHVSPANHFPLGAVMSAERRDQLLAWAGSSPNRYVIEDDYDSELRFSGRGLPPLAAVADTDSVVYLNTFSKTLVPSIRISYMVLPDALMDLYRRQLSFYSCTVSSFEQLALAQFISEGYFERHIGRLRRFYGSRRKEVLEAVASSPLARVAQARASDVGTHLVLCVRTSMSDEQVERAARGRGLNIAMLSDYCAAPTALHAHAVVLNFASIAPGRVREAVDLLADVFSCDVARAGEK